MKLTAHWTWDPGIRDLSIITVVALYSFVNSRLFESPLTRLSEQPSWFVRIKNKTLKNRTIIEESKVSLDDVAYC